MRKLFRPIKKWTETNQEYHGVGCDIHPFNLHCPAKFAGLMIIQREKTLQCRFPLDFLLFCVVELTMKSNRIKEFRALARTGEQEERNFVLLKRRSCPPVRSLWRRSRELKGNRCW